MSTIADTIDILNADEFTSGNFGLQGFDAQNDTDWLDAVSRNANTKIHNFSVAGGEGNTSTVFGNLREVEGVMMNSGFDQFNTRASIQTTALNDKLEYLSTLHTPSVSSKMDSTKPSAMRCFITHLHLYSLQTLQQHCS